ncbi:hypothetical protein ACFV5G_29805 [Streptomyces sp. NPDC059766]|uniref:hypothetical protein n=1 Tax=Streptomyces sp. NPDC059766 TaxID=3346940 RepID=UPI0036466B73
MSDEFPTPSQAEGERDDEAESSRPEIPRTTPSQAEGEDTEDEQGMEATGPHPHDSPGPVRRQDIGS